uniref:Nucleoside recognition family protein n=1 Tax=uncultured Thiotrichaceae bacterium TaxID=298394 RepID=A0A6S6UKY2_9GAMM|nr:MAG: Nucleoside recognition family protein [uncultured Thiotrichaceae bacterium]
MTEFVELILSSGRAGVEIALFVFLPIMIVMLTFMRLLEARGILGWIVVRIAPFFLPFGVTGLGVFALIQVLFVSVAAPVATLAMMNNSGVSRRHISATLAMVFGAAQANVTFPMSAVGLHGGSTILISAIAGLLGAAATYYVFARHLPERELVSETLPEHPVVEGANGVMAVISAAGKEAFNIAINAIPMLVLALLLVNVLRSLGVIGILESALTPLFVILDLPAAALLPAVTKYIAGGTAMMGVMMDSMEQGLVSVGEFNRLAGFLINPLDVAGVAIMMTAGSRVAEVIKPALYGAAVAIVIRSLVHYWWFA